MKRKVFWIFVVVCIAGVFLWSFCGKTEDREEIVLFISATSETLEAHKEQVRLFEQNYPQYHVSIINGVGQNDGGMQKLQTMIASGSPPDVSYIHGASFPIFVRKKLLTDLNAFNAADENPLDLSIYYPRVLELCRDGDSLYSLPIGTVTFVMFYNRSMFEESEIPLPFNEWTWSDYLEMARRLTEDLDNDGRTDRFGCAIQFEPNITLPWVRQAGGDLMNADNTRCILDSQEAREALQFLLDLKNRWKVAPSSSESSGQGIGQMFLTGQIGMMVGSSAAMSTLEKQASRFDWDVAPLPQYKVRSGRLGTANWGIFENCKNKKAAWTLLKFLAGSEGQNILMRKTGLVPSIKQLAENGELQKQFPRRNIGVLLDSISYGRPGCRFYYWNEVYRAIQPAYDLLWISDKPDVAVTLRDATLRANENIQATRRQQMDGGQK